MVATLPCTVYLSEMKRSEGPGRGGITTRISGKTFLSFWDKSRLEFNIEGDGIRKFDYIRNANVGRRYHDCGLLTDFRVSVASHSRR